MACATQRAYALPPSLRRSAVRGQGLLHEYAVSVYSHTNHVGGPSDPPSLDSAPGEGPRTPVSVGIEAPAGIATDRPTGLPRSARGVSDDGGPRRVRVAIVGATGYVGAELIRILARHPIVARLRS